MQATCGIAANSKAFHKGFTGIASSAAFLNLQRSFHQQGGEPMNPIFDTAMLKHHHVEYHNRIDTDGPRRPAIAGRTFTLVTIAVLAVSLVTTFKT
jgi:hypothetical protein